VKWFGNNGASLGCYLCYAGIQNSCKNLQPRQSCLSDTCVTLFNHKRTHMFQIHKSLLAQQLCQNRAYTQLCIHTSMHLHFNILINPILAQNLTLSMHTSQIIRLKSTKKTIKLRHMHHFCTCTRFYTHDKQECGKNTCTHVRIQSLTCALWHLRFVPPMSTSHGHSFQIFVHIKMYANPSQVQACAHISGFTHVHISSFIHMHTS
jgi:hypothetical protein